MKHAPLTFGRQWHHLSAESRRAAYAVVVQHERIATVRFNNHAFLPGGGMLEGETPEETMHREVREELARTITLHTHLGTVMQYFRSGDVYYEMQATFMLGTFGNELDRQREHDLVWLDPSECHAFFHDSHVWAVEQALNVRLREAEHMAMKRFHG